MNLYRVWYKDYTYIDITCQSIIDAKFKANLKTSKPNTDILRIEYLGMQNINKEENIR